MEDAVSCPSCQSHNVSKTTKGKWKEGAATAAAFSGVLVAKTMLGPLGKFIPGGKSVKVLSHLVAVDYVCNDCYQMFQVKSDSNGEVQQVTKDTKYNKAQIESARGEMIEQKEHEANKYKRKAVWHSVFAFLSLVYALCYIQDKPGAVGLGIFLMIIFGCIAIAKVCSYSKKTDEIAQLSAMSLLEYRYKFM